MRVALIGLGYWGKIIYKNLKQIPEITEIKICDPLFSGQKVDGIDEEIDNKYATLKKFDVQIPESEEELFTSLRAEWAKFKETMSSAETMLKNSKNNMQLDVENELETRVQESINIRKDANTKLPFTDDLSPADSMKKIEEYKEKLISERGRQDKLKSGLAIFNLEEPEFKETLT